MPRGVDDRHRCSPDVRCLTRLSEHAHRLLLRREPRCVRGCGGGQGWGAVARHAFCEVSEEGAPGPVEEDIRWLVVTRRYADGVQVLYRRENVHCQPGYLQEPLSMRSDSDMFMRGSTPYFSPSIVVTPRILQNHSLEYLTGRSRSRSRHWSPWKHPAIDPVK